MPIINSDDYHLYVFKDGKLIGEFEQMYQKSRQITWHQDKDPQSLEVYFGMYFPKIKKVCQNIVSLMDKKGYILVQQNFPPPHSNFVGKEVLPNPETLLSYFKSKIDEIVVNYLEDNKKNQSNDNWMYMFGVKK